MEATIYVPEAPDVIITAEGMVHLSYTSGAVRFERVFLVEQWESFLLSNLELVKEWRASRVAPSHAAALSAGG